MTPSVTRSLVRLQFSLKTLLLLAGAVCVFLGWWCNNARRQKHAVEFVFRNDGNVAYTFNRRPNNQPPPPPEWMMQRDVCDYFFNVIGIGILDGADFHERDLEVLRDLPNIAELTLEGQQFTDESVDHIVCLRNLRYLCLMNTRVSDSGLARLQQTLPNCNICR